MKAITIRAPWALAIAAGVKTVENRGRPTSHRGPVAIHTAAAWSRDGARDPRIRQWWLGRETAERVPEVDAADIAGGHVFRHILVVAELADCHPAGPCVNLGCGPWGDHDYNGKPAWHLVLANARRLAEPVPARGSLAVPWTLPDDVAEQVERQLAEAVT